MTENIAGRQEEFVIGAKSGMPIPDELQEKVTNCPPKGLDRFLLPKHV